MPVAGVSCLVLSAVVELMHWRASRQALGHRGAGDRAGAEVVLVLGYPSRARGGLHPMQRWRTQVAVRSMHPQRGRLVFSGAGPEGAPSEAEVMAAHARDVFGVPARRITVETRAVSTWQNVRFSLAHLQGADSIAVASSPLHAARARRYLTQQRPDLAERLVASDDYRIGEGHRWKAATVAYGLLSAARRLVLSPAPWHAVERAHLRALRGTDSLTHAWQRRAGVEATTAPAPR